MRAALLLGLAACAEPHVMLKAPAPSITPADRVAMFKALEPTKQETLTISRNHGPKELAGAGLILANGSEIQLPEDLLPVVAPDSDTARAARASAAAGHRANTWMYIGYTVAVTSIIGLVTYEAGDPDVAFSDNYLWGAALLATGVPFYIAHHDRHEELQLRMQAFSTYTRDLGMRLDVCAHGLEVIACETPVAPNAPGMVAPSAPGMVTPNAPGMVTPNAAPAPSAQSPYPPAPGTNAPATTQPAPAPAHGPIVDPFAPPPTQPAP